MFVLLVVLGFLGIVILPVVFLLDPLEVKKRSPESTRDGRQRGEGNTIAMPHSVDHHAATSRAK